MKVYRQRSSRYLSSVGVLWVLIALAGGAARAQSQQGNIPPPALPPCIPTHADVGSHVPDYPGYQYAFTNGTDYGYRCPDGSFQPFFAAQFNGVVPEFKIEVDANTQDNLPRYVEIYAYRWDFAAGQWVYLGHALDSYAVEMSGRLPPEGGILRVLVRAERDGTLLPLQVNLWSWSQ
jgi:hypothetical protein